MESPDLVTITPTVLSHHLKESQDMPGSKRSHDGVVKDVESAASPSPFMPMFEGFRDELDQHHDRRERIIKASRDITASSKKM